MISYFTVSFVCFFFHRRPADSVGWDVGLLDSLACRT